MLIFNPTSESDVKLISMKKKHDVDLFGFHWAPFKRRKWRDKLYHGPGQHSITWGRAISHTCVSPAPSYRYPWQQDTRSKCTSREFCFFVSHSHKLYCKLTFHLYLNEFVVVGFYELYFFNASHAVTQCARVATRGLRVLIYMHERSLSLALSSSSSDPNPGCQITRFWYRV